MTVSDDGAEAVLGSGRPEDQHPLRRYLETIRDHWKLIFLTVLLCTAGAAAYALTAPKTYRAQASMLVTPLPPDQTSLPNVGLVRAASDPTRDVTTASLLVKNTTVAGLVRQNLSLAESPQNLLKRVAVEPVANSSIISVTASASTARLAQRLANGFANAAIQQRTSQLHKALIPAIASLRSQIQQDVGTAGSSAVTQPLYQQLAAMQAMAGSPDPTLSLQSAALLPPSAALPQEKLDIAGGLIAGLLIGIAGAFLFAAVNPSKAREEDLGAAGLPVLTRVPPRGRGAARRLAFEEAFRYLSTTLQVSSDESSLGTIAVTSASEKEGKTTTSWELAKAMLESGRKVLLVEADFFRPDLRSLLGMELDAWSPGLADYLSGTASLASIVHDTTTPGLRFICSGAQQSASVNGLLAGARGRTVVHALSRQADLVILDCPPAGLRSAAILIAAPVDAVLMVVDLERSKERDVLETVKRLRMTGAHVRGIVLNHDRSASSSYAYGPEMDLPSRSTEAISLPDEPPHPSVRRG